ncbi:MAG: hypothetical protein RLZZ488_2463 [Pseudomonadota bacterium]
MERLSSRPTPKLCSQIKKFSVLENLALNLLKYPRAMERRGKKIVIQRMILALPATLGCAFLALSSASAATCTRWVTQCTNTCTQQDEYGSCTAWSQDCTQVCGEWSTEHAVTEKGAMSNDDAALHRLFTKAVAHYPKDAKSMTWRFNKQGQIVIEDVQR